MWSKVLVLTLVTAALAVKPPRKLFDLVDSDQDVPITPLVDPIDGLAYRLPNTTLPIRYDIWLSTEIHRGEFGFTGRVSIQILALQNTNSITLHYRELTITNVNLARANGSIIQAQVPHRLREDTEFLIITPTEPLVINQIYVVGIMYAGILRNDDAGFYRSSYRDAQGEVKWLATTQFESTDARHAFPCFDEPGIRSRYSIEIRHHNTYTAISNMPQVSRLPEGSSEFVVTKFAEIPSVQSYLLAFTVSDFTFVESSGEPIHQRVFGKPQNIANGEGALAIEVSGKILAGFENYLGVNFSLPKMDQAAIPDFAAGAMENWGLVTYAEPYLLYNPVTATARNREGVIGTIAHEFAHQWFGNLVSPAWWSYLWLNEGFATLYADYLTDKVFPGERWADTFLVETVQPVMETDSNLFIRPMSYYVESPEAVDGLFDNVAYSKSGSVLRMFLNVFGEQVWKEGLKNYLEARGWNVATPADLYAGIQAAVDLLDEKNYVNVAAVMGSWETQSGFPYVTITRNGGELTLTQNRFLYSNRNSTNVWWIPMNFVVGINPDFSRPRPELWMEGEQTKTVKVDYPTDSWLVANTQAAYYYRVNYDDNLWNLLIQQLNKEGSTEFARIHVLNRAQLIDDSFHMARAGLLDFDTTFGVMNYLEKETDYIPWTPANRANTLLNRWLTGTAVYPHYQTFMRKNVQALFTRLGTNIVNNEQRVDRYARTVAINIACQAQLDECLTKTTQSLQTMIDSGNALAPDLVSSIYCNGLRKAPASLFNAMKDKMLQSSSQAERNTIIASLGCTQDGNQLLSLLALTLDSSVTLSGSEKSRIFSAPINTGEASIRTMIAYAKTNAGALKDANLLNSILNNIAARITSEELREEFVTLLTSLRGLNQITEAKSQANRNSAGVILTWQAENLGPIMGFFDVDGGRTTSTTLGAGSVVVSTTILVLCAFVKQLF